MIMGEDTPASPSDTSPKTVSWEGFPPNNVEKSPPLNVKSYSQKL